MSEEIKPKSKAKQYFIANPAGAIHKVSQAHANKLLRKVGYRSATSAEVKALQAKKGAQDSRNPIVEPFSAEATPVEL